MKKSSVVLINLFLSMCCVRAMDNDSTKAEQTPLIEYKNPYNMTLKKRAIKGHEHIVYMSFRDIRHSVESLSTEKQKKIGLKLSQCAAFTIAMLPFELRYRVIKEVVDGDEHIANEFFCMPILQAFELYAEIQKHCPLKIGNKELSVFDLWRLPRKKRNELIEKVTPTVFSQLTGSHAIFEPEEFENLQIILSDDFVTELEVEVSRGLFYENHVGKIFGGFVMFSGSVMAIVGGAGHVFPLLGIGLGIMALGPLIGCYVRCRMPVKTAIRRVDIKIEAEEV